ncbi:hypothetical protein [Aureliella helgolandensis]|nr:hypothetical protein [Aureliella helgolandensis]
MASEIEKANAAREAFDSQFPLITPAHDKTHLCEVGFSDSSLF